MKNPVFIDIETCGLVLDLNPIWEIAVISNVGEEVIQVRVPDGLPVVDDSEALFQAEPFMSKWVAENTGFKERYDAETALPPFQALQWLTNRLTETTDAADGCRPTFVGAAPSFDERFLLHLFSEHIGSPSKADPWMWDHHLVCVEVLAAGYLTAKSHSLPERWSLSSFADIFDVPPLPTGERHTALGDARLTKALYERITEAQENE